MAISFKTVAQLEPVQPEAPPSEVSLGLRFIVLAAHGLAIGSLWFTTWFETLKTPKMPPVQVALLTPAEVDRLIKDATSDLATDVKTPTEEAESPPPPPEPAVPEQAEVAPPVAVLPPEPVRIPQPPPQPQPPAPPPPEPNVPEPVPQPPQPTPPKPKPPKPTPPKPEPQPTPPEPDVKAVVKPPPPKPVPPKPTPKPVPPKPDVKPQPSPPAKPTPPKPIPAKPLPATPPSAPGKPTPAELERRMAAMRGKLLRRPGSTASNPFNDLRAPTASEIAARIGNRIRNVSLGNIRSAGPAASAADMAHFFAIVQSKLYNAWKQPSRAEVASGKPTVTVSLTVLADGSVKSTRLVSRSGSGAMDGSVSAALGRVGRLPPLRSFGITSSSLTMEVLFELD